MTATEQAIQEKELEQLVSLAEEISSKIEELKGGLGDREYKMRNMNNIMSLCFLVGMFCVYSVVTGITIPFSSRGFVNTILFFISLAFTLLLMLIYLFKLRIVRENNKELKTKIVQE